MEVLYHREWIPVSQHGYAVAAAVTKLFARVWMGDASVDGIVADLRTIVRASGEEASVQRRLTLELSGVAEAVSTRMSPIVEREFSGLGEGDRAVVVEHVQACLRNAHVSDVRDIVAANASVKTLFSMLQRAGTPQLSSLALGSEGEAFLDLVLIEVAQELVEIATAMPSYSAVRDAALLGRSANLEQLAKELLDRLPAASDSEAQQPADYSRYEQLFRAEVHQRANVVRLFGLDGDSAIHKYALSTGYTSLAVYDDGEPDPATARASKIDPESLPGPKPARASGIEATADVRLEDLLIDHDAILLVGGAGSGKTTLLNWIALSSVAPPRSTRVPDSWRGRLPFTVPLRRFVDAPLPTIDQLAGLAAPTVGDPPPGWARKVFSDGRATLLVDGLDEVPKKLREDVRTWVDAILALFPTTKVVVSSRAVGMPRKWSEDRTYRRAELLPMRPDDVRVFVDRWHRAAQEVGWESEEFSADDAARSVNEIIRTRSALRTLCTTPLLCALICSLHVRQGANLPRNRTDLYDKALSMLLSARDSERRVLVSSFELSQPQRRALVQEFALWMHENALSDTTYDDYVASIWRTLRRLSIPGTDGSTVANILLERSGVLREPAPGRVDFVHRSFLEYLAASAIVDDDSIEKLVIHAPNDQWREVIVLAAGIANRKQREQLLTKLLETGAESPAVRHRYYLLAIACLETSLELPPKLRKTLLSAVQEVVPPRGMVAAAAIASAGDLAVDRLRRTPALTARPAAASVRALSMIGTENALRALESYRGESRKTVTRELLRAWSNFDPGTYASSILADVDFSAEPILVTDSSLVPHLVLLPPSASIFIDLPGRYETPAEVPALPANVFGANFSAMSGIRDIADLPLTSAESFVLDDTDIRSLAGVEAHPALFYLGLSNTRELSTGGDLSQHRFLSNVRISGSQLDSVDFLQTPTPIRSVVLGMLANLRAVQVPITARSLVLQHCSNLVDIDVLSSAEDLRELTVRWLPVQRLPLPSQLTRLRISGILPGATIEGGASVGSLQLDAPALSMFADWICGLEKLAHLHVDLWSNTEPIDRDLFLSQVQRIAAIAHPNTIVINTRNYDFRDYEIEGYGLPLHTGMTRGHGFFRYIHQFN